MGAHRGLPVSILLLGPAISRDFREAFARNLQHCILSALNVNYGFVFVLQ
jgi:hypothetical protein